jgi:hypothetical protein
MNKAGGRISCNKRAEPVSFIHHPPLRDKKRHRKTAAPSERPTWVIGLIQWRNWLVAELTRKKRLEMPVLYHKKTGLLHCLMVIMKSLGPAYAAFRDIGG